MASRTIPARTITTCDRCGDECGQYGIRAEGTQSGRALGGSGGGPFELDLCERCTVALHDWLRAGREESPR